MKSSLIVFGINAFVLINMHGFSKDMMTVAMWHFVQASLNILFAMFFLITGKDNYGKLCLLAAGVVFLIGYGICTINFKPG